MSSDQVHTANAPSTSIHDLPGELLDLIIASLKPAEKYPKEKGDLKTCALVCRRWRDFALDHLFRDLAFSFVYGPDTECWDDAPSAVQERVSKPAEKNWYTFFGASIPRHTLSVLHAFLSTSPHIRARIRSLHLEAKVGYPMPAQTQIDGRLFLSTLVLLPQLRELSLSQVILATSTRIPKAEQPCLHLDRLAVDILSSAPTRDPSPAQVAWILATSVSKVTSLRVYGYSRRETTQLASTLNRFTSSLRSLSLRLCALSEDFFPRLLRSPAVGALERLAIEFLDLPSHGVVEGINQFLAAHGRGLRELVFVVDETALIGADDIPTLDLSPCTALAALGLRASACAFSAPWTPVLAALASLPSDARALRRLSFDGSALQPGGDGEAEEGAAEARRGVEDALLAFCKRDASVVVRFHGGEGQRCCAASVFPKLCEQGRVELVSEDMVLT